MKNKLLITEEERKRILTSHIKAGYKTNVLEFYLNEDETIGGSAITPEKILESYNALKQIIPDGDFTNYSKITDKSFVAFRKMASYNISSLAYNWEVTTRTAIKDKNFNIDTIKSDLPKYSQIHYLYHCFQVYLNRTDKSEITGIIIKPAGEEVKITEIPKEAPDPIVFEPINGAISTDGTAGGVFADNQSDPLPETMTIVDNFLKTTLQKKINDEINADPKVKEEYERNPNQFKFECTDLLVFAAASRYANTGIAQNMNFITLSKARADKGYDEVIKLLQNNNVSFTDEFSEKEKSQRLQYDGDNGDGTNGPVVPYGNRVAQLDREGKENTTPVYLDTKNPNYDSEYNETALKYKSAPTDEDLKLAREELTKKLKELQQKDPEAKLKIPEKIKDLYDQYKVFVVQFSLILTYNYIPTEPTKPDIDIIEEKFPLYTINFIKQKDGSGGGGGRGKIKFPPIRLTPSRRKGRQGWGKNECKPFKGPGFWKKLLAGQVTKKFK